MFLEQTTLTCQPGQRFAGLDHLKQLATWCRDELGLSSTVYGNAAGNPYRYHLISRIASLTQQLSSNQAVINSSYFQTWFAQSSEIFVWSLAEVHLYQLHRLSPHDKPHSFATAALLRLLPGKRWAGVAHLNRLAEHLEGDYGHPSHVVSAVDGDAYLHAIITEYPDADAFAALDEMSRSDETYAAWFEEARGAVDFDSLVFNLFHHHG